MSARKLLGIYLNDHLGGATAGVELAKRSLRANREGELGRFLARLLGELEEDRLTLRRVMRDLGVRESRGKQAAGLVAERVGRLKLNGRLTGYSPLSRVLELEGLVIGVEGKLSLWEHLGEVLPAAVRGVDFEELAQRARRQQNELAEFKLSAAREAFTDEGPGV